MEYYKLISAKGYCEAIFVRNAKMTGCLDGDLYTVTGWDCDNKEPDDIEYFSNAYIKWDGCSHLSFKGQSYDPHSKKDDHDFNYHVCGYDGYIEFNRNMAFMYKLATQVMDRYDEEEFEKILNINGKVLEGYKIEKVDKPRIFKFTEM